MARLLLLAAALVAAVLLWRRLAGRAARAGDVEQALRLHLRLPEPEAWPGLEARLRERVARGGLGEVEEGVGEGDRRVLWLYGPDAHRLLDAVAPLLREAGVHRDSHAVARRGGPGAPEQRMELDEGEGPGGRP